MKKYFLIFLIISVIAPSIAFALPSFEVYPVGKNPWPEITFLAADVVGINIKVTAEITDISGVNSASIIIKNATTGEQKYSGAILDNGSFPDATANDDIYTVGFSINQSGDYNVYISATDNLGNSPPTPLALLGSFTIDAPNCATNSAGNATICISASPIIISPTTTSQSISSFLINGSATPPGISAGQTATLAVQLSSAIAGETINFIDTATGQPIIAPITTNSSGLASYTTYKPVFNGTHNIEAIFAGDSLRGINASIKSVPLTVSGKCATNSAGNATICIATSVQL